REGISGSEEAARTFAGATGVRGGDPLQRVLVVDVGGGSTEFVLGAGSSAQQAVSTDMGCVRFTERHMRSDPPTGAERSAAACETLSILDEVAQQVALHETQAVIGVAGTVNTVTAHALKLQEYDAAAVHGTELEVPTLQQSVKQLVSASRQQRSAMPFMHPGRVDVIG